MQKELGGEVKDQSSYRNGERVVTRCGRQVVARALRRWDKWPSFQAGQQRYGRGGGRFYSDSGVLCSLSERWSLGGRLLQSSRLTGTIGRVLGSLLGAKLPIRQLWDGAPCAARALGGLCHAETQGLPLLHKSESE